MRLLVTGGSGVLGREVSAAASPRGHVVRIASLPSCGAEAAARVGSGGARIRCRIARRVSGSRAIVHAASDPRRPEIVDISGTRRLVAAARDAGVQHLVYVSIVGLEHIPVRYYRAKLVAEAIVQRAVSGSILRASQFHSFIDVMLAGLARVPLVLPVPRGFRFQSVAGDAADREQWSRRDARDMDG